MKKTILALSLLSAFSLNNIVNASDINEFERDYLRIHETNTKFLESLFPSTHEFKGLVGSGGEAEYDFVQSTLMPFSDQFTLYYNLNEKGKVALKRYERSQGVATLSAEVIPSILYKEGKREYDVSFMEPGTAIISLDKKNRRFKSDLTFGKQVPKITVYSRDDSGESLEFIEGLAWGFDSITNKKEHTYGEEFRAIETFKNEFIINDYFLDFSERTLDDNKPFDRLTADKVEFNADYDLVTANYIHGLTLNRLALDAKKYDVTLKKFDYLYTFLTNTKKELGDLTEKMIIDDLMYASKDNGISVSFGGGMIEYGADNLRIEKPEKILKLSQSIVNAIAAEVGGDNAALEKYQRELMEIYNTILVDGTKFKYLIDLYAPNDQHSANIKVEAVLAKAMNNIEQVFEESESMADVLEYIESLTFEIVFSDEYLVDQYVSFLQLKGEVDSLEEARKKAKSEISVMIMMGTALAPEGVTLIDRVGTNNQLKVYYKDQTWTINGKEFSNDEFSELMNNF